MNLKSKNLAGAVLLTGTLIVPDLLAGQGPQPSICTRPCWGARAPACNPGNIATLARATIHHTAGTGDWTTNYETGKSRVRGIQNYHIDTAGFCDISYHFLVNAAGHLYEGRYAAMGGLPKSYHDCCNNNSFGFNVMGYYHPPYNQSFTTASLNSLMDVIAWRMPSNWSPYGTSGYCSRTIGVLDGHRNVVESCGPTACPGDGIYNSWITGDRWGGPIRNGVNSRKSGCDINMTQGAIRIKYEAWGGCGSVLGAPTTWETPTPDGWGRYNHFQHSASIYWTEGTGAQVVRNAIRDKWAALGWEQGAIGYPVTDETGTPDGIGAYNHFQNGAIYWSPSTGAQMIKGSIRDKWASLGWEQGFLGYPTTDETPINGGWFNHFQGGSIYASGVGTFEIHGAIRDKWISMGAENSCLGYPTSDEYAWGNGARSDFQWGYITWDPANGAVPSCGQAVDVVLDNEQAGFSFLGTWTLASGATDKYGPNYRYRATASVSQPATWVANLSASGTYTVYAWWSQGANRSATAPYQVTHTGGTTTINKNQQVGGGSWQSLGNFNLNSGNNTVKLSCWTTTGYVVMADAIRWYKP